jgi:hypothetical protein
MTKWESRISKQSLKIHIRRVLSIIRVLKNYSGLQRASLEVEFVIWWCGLADWL